MTKKFTDKQYQMMLTALKIAQCKAYEWMKESNDVESWDHYSALHQDFLETETALRIMFEDGENE